MRQRYGDLVPTYQEAMLGNEYVEAALTAKLKQPELSECAAYLVAADEERLKTKGKYMSLDHLKQEAVKWASDKSE